MSRVFGRSGVQCRMGRKSQINPSNLTYSTPIETPQGRVGFDLATGKSSETAY